MLLIQLVCGLFGVLYVVSWGVLLGGFLGMLLFPMPPYTGVAMALALYYLAGCWLIRGLARLCGYGRPSAPMVLPPPAAPVVIRRVILEEITPDDRQRRIVLQDIPPSDERTGHAG